MTDVTIYTTRLCGYCFAAKRLLNARRIPYEEIDVSGNADRRAWLVEATGQRTVPQIFIKGESIGGYEELAAMDKAGGLAGLAPATA